jgi:hypothetical protein
MADYTDEVTEECAIRAVFAIDVLDRDRDLLISHIPLDETLSDCGVGGNEAGLLETWVNRRRALAGKPALPGGTIAPATTIREVISHVCD